MRSARSLSRLRAPSRSAVGCGLPLSIALSTALVFAGSLIASAVAAEVLDVHSGAACGFIAVQPECPPEVTDTATASFRAAIAGQPTTYISFSQDKDDNDLADPVDGFDSAVPGDLFSDRVVLSSLGPPEPSLPTHVQLTIDNQGNKAQVGPVDGFSGILEIAFVAPHPIAVGLGPVLFGLAGGGPDAITVYDSEGGVLYMDDDVSTADDFTFIGFTSETDQPIGRVVLEGDFFSVQDLQFVPEPGATAQALAAIATLGLLAGARSRTSGMRSVIMT